MRHLRVTADVQQVMERLTDSARRERAWLRRAGQREGLRESRVDRLPDGRLRRRYELALGRRVWRVTTEDVAITETTIEVVHRGELAGPRLIPVRWVITECVSAEPAEHGTDITVHALSQMSGPGRGRRRRQRRVSSPGGPLARRRHHDRPGRCHRGSRAVEEAAPQ